MQQPLPEKQLTQIIQTVIMQLAWSLMPVHLWQMIKTSQDFFRNDQILLPSFLDGFAIRWTIHCALGHG